MVIRSVAPCVPFINREVNLCWLLNRVGFLWFALLLSQTILATHALFGQRRVRGLSSPSRWQGRRWWRGDDAPRRHTSPSDSQQGPSTLPWRAGHLLSDSPSPGDTHPEGADEDEQPEDYPHVLYHPPPGSTEPPTRAVILMDAFCVYHGLYFARSVLEFPRVAIIRVLSNYVRQYVEHQQLVGDEVEDNDANSERPWWDLMRIPETPEQATAWKLELQELLGHDGNTTNRVEWVGVYCESDSGLADAERLRQLLSVTCQDEPPVHDARRNKFLMIKTVGQYQPPDGGAKLAVPSQKLCFTLQEAMEFCQPWLERDGRVVVKPFRGVASESVALCSQADDVEKACRTILSSTVFGSHETHDCVLVQEFVPGTEFAVDIVSRNGHHKVAAVWKYDKRPVHDAAFCYFKTELVDATSRGDHVMTTRMGDLENQDDSSVGRDEEVAAVMKYARSALDALGVKWGMSHNEIMVHPTRGPMLIEVNCRQHNMDFSPLTMACLGYNSLDMMASAFLDPGNDDGDTDWDQYPDEPQLRCHGCMVHLVNYRAGKLSSVNFLEEMSQLESVMDWKVYDEFLAVGNMIEPTVNIRTDAGWVQLVHQDLAALQKDYDQIVAWMPHMFQVEEPM